VKGTHVLAGAVREICHAGSGVHGIRDAGGLHDDLHCDTGGLDDAALPASFELFARRADVISVAGAELHA
jgi:hypothetical protein